MWECWLACVHSICPATSCAVCQLRSGSSYSWGGLIYEKEKEEYTTKSYLCICNTFISFAGNCCWTITFCAYCRMKLASSFIWSYLVWWAIRYKRSLWTFTMSQTEHRNCSPTCWTTCHVSNGLSLYFYTCVCVSLSALACVCKCELLFVCKSVGKKESSKQAHEKRKFSLVVVAFVIIIFIYFYFLFDSFSIWITNNVGQDSKHLTGLWTTDWAIKVQTHGFSLMPISKHNASINYNLIDWQAPKLNRQKLNRHMFIYCLYI